MLTRRHFVQGIAATAISLASNQADAGEKKKRKTMAIVSTEWRYHSHSQHMGTGSCTATRPVVRHDLAILTTLLLLEDSCSNVHNGAADRSSALRV